MKKWPILFLLSVITALTAAAQDQERNDNNNDDNDREWYDRHERKNRRERERTLFSGLRFSGAWGGPAVGIARFGNDNALLRGGFGGLEFNKSLFIGYGGFEIDESVRLNTLDFERFRFRYNGPMIQYTFIPHKVVHPSISFMAGPGKVSLNDGPTDRVVIIQPSAGLEINVFRWMHVGAEAGYRFVTDTGLPNLNDKDLSAPFAEVKFKFGISWR